MPESNWYSWYPRCNNYNWKTTKTTGRMVFGRLNGTWANLSQSRDVSSLSGPGHLALKKPRWCHGVESLSLLTGCQRTLAKWTKLLIRWLELRQNMLIRKRLFANKLLSTSCMREEGETKAGTSTRKQTDSLSSCRCYHQSQTPN